MLKTIACDAHRCSLYIVRRVSWRHLGWSLVMPTRAHCWVPVCAYPAGSRFFLWLQQQNFLCQKFKHVRGMLRSAAPKNVAKCRQKMKLVCPGTTTAFAQILWKVERCLGSGEICLLDIAEEMCPRINVTPQRSSSTKTVAKKSEKNVEVSNIDGFELANLRTFA